jgi:hypothetical protein
MNVIIVSFFNHWVTHLGTELELAEIHLQQGDSVTFLACDGSVGACMTNPDGSADVCSQCRLKRLDGIDQLSGEVAVYSLNSPLSQNEALDAACLPDSPSIDDYKALKYKGHDLGWAALSSTNMLYRDPLCDSKKAMQAAEVFLGAAILSYEGTRRFLGKHEKFDRGYVFNGRFAVTRGAFRAMQEAKIPVFTHERGSSINHYQLFPNTFPHDQKLFQERVIASWAKAADLAQRDKTANLFFQAQKTGKPLYWKSFIENQNFGGLPKKWDAKALNIVIFNSSEDELAAVSDIFTDPVYPSQAIAVERIVADTLASRKPIHYYLRIHPNLAGVENSSLASLLAVSSPNLTIIDADDSISTYCLLDACDRVMTFGSTVGVEATYWGKPSILTGKSRYDDLDVAYRPHSHEEVMDLLLKDQLAPKKRLGALMYGYYARTRGTLFEHWKPQDLESGSFKDMFIGNGVLHTKNRPPKHIEIFLALTRFCKSQPSIRVADRVAGCLSTLHRRVKKLAMLTLVRGAQKNKNDTPK